jgi:hypothetical protein
MPVLVAKGPAPRGRLMRSSEDRLTIATPAGR